MRPVAQIAQSVEQGIENPRVGGSIPSLGTTNTEKPQAKMPSLGFFIACDFVASGQDFWCCGRDCCDHLGHQPQRCRVGLASRVRASLAAGSAHGSSVRYISWRAAASRRTDCRGADPETPFAWRSLSTAGPNTRTKLRPRDSQQQPGDTRDTPGPTRTPNGLAAGETLC